MDVSAACFGGVVLMKFDIFSLWTRVLCMMWSKTGRCHVAHFSAIRTAF